MDYFSCALYIIDPQEGNEALQQQERKSWGLRNKHDAEKLENGNRLPALNSTGPQTSVHSGKTRTKPIMQLSAIRDQSDAALKKSSTVCETK